VACLDTSVLIDLLRPPSHKLHRAASDVLVSHLNGTEDLCTTRLCEAELLVGVHRCRDRAAELARVQRILWGFVLLEFDAAAAEHFGPIKAHLMNIGRPAGDMDVMIASVAIANGHSLLTRNRRHFADIPGLQIYSY
jgi:predicted nucleic acid-binding protein